MDTIPRKPAYWLFKTEPNVYSLEDLKKDKVAEWEGVRNYQARNLLRDTIQVGDGVLFYHSRIKPMAVMGIAKVARAGYPDFTQWDPKAEYFDPKASQEEPRWYMVDVQYISTFTTPVTLEKIKTIPECHDMVLINRSRLSIQPVKQLHWDTIIALGNSE